MTSSIKLRILRSPVLEQSMVLEHDWAGRGVLLHAGGGVFGLAVSSSFCFLGGWIDGLRDERNDDSDDCEEMVDALRFGMLIRGRRRLVTVRED
jgi:hypothetical protein